MAKMGFSVYGEFPDIWEIAVLAKTRFSGPPKKTHFQNHQNGVFWGPPKKAVFSGPPKRGRFLRPEKDRFLGPGNKACF